MSYIEGRQKCNVWDRFCGLTWVWGAALDVHKWWAGGSVVRSVDDLTVSLLLPVGHMMSLLGQYTLVVHPQDKQAKVD